MSSSGRRTAVALSCFVSFATPAVAAESASSVPDFSGIWAHIVYPDVEPPHDGPGPVRNLSRLKGNVPMPFNGAAVGTISPNGVSNASELVGDYNNPILKPAAAAIVKQHGEISRRGIPYPTPANQCWPGGVPFVFWNIGMQMLQQKNEVTILYSNDHEVRHIRLNARHPEHVASSWYGDSVGHYEGDVLVVDTVGVKAGPYAMVDMYGTPHSEALHVVERYRLLDGQAATESEERGERENFRFELSDAGFARRRDNAGPGLLLEFRVDDPGVFTTPWSAMITYRRPLGDWPDMACADSTHDFLGRMLNVPKADKPDF